MLLKGKKYYFVLSFFLGLRDVHLFVGGHRHLKDERRDAHCPGPLYDAKSDHHLIHQDLFHAQIPEGF